MDLVQKKQKVEVAQTDNNLHHFKRGVGTVQSDCQDCIFIATPNKSMLEFYRVSFSSGEHQP